MKKKILALCLVVVLAITAITGATLAYFTDTDVQENVFTVGNVKIDLFEDFNSDKLELIPAVYVEEKEGVEGWGTYKNKIEKEVYVENEGSQDAYVRVQIAIPAVHRAAGFKKFLEDNGYKLDGKVINFTCDEFTTAEGLWNWTTELGGRHPTANPGAEWNYYPTNSEEVIEINDVPYMVFVVTYETVLKAGKTPYDVTCDAINGVYMNPGMTQDMVEYLDRTYGENEWTKVYVVAEATQAEGFTDAYTALNTAFGIPSEYTVHFADSAEGDTFREHSAMSETK